MAKVLVAGALDEAGLRLLEARADIRYEVVSDATISDLDARIADLDAIVLRLTPIDAATIAKACRLKVVSRFGVGFDNVDLEALTRHGIPLAVVGDANVVTVAEHAFGLMIAVSRQLVVQDQELRNGNFGIRHAADQTELFGKVVLIVGYGRIGRQVARRCTAFAMNVVVADPFVSREEVTEDGYGHIDDFRDGLADADFVTFHLPALPDGDALMAADEFAKMKTGACFINVARGSLVDEAALADALAEGRLRGAALDVLREEPPSSSNRLLGLENVVLTPHSAALTKECRRRMSIVCVQNALDGIDGKLRLEYVVNREVLSLPPS